MRRRERPNATVATPTARQDKPSLLPPPRQPHSMTVSCSIQSCHEASKAPGTNERQAINRSWQIAIQEILPMVIRDRYHAGGEAAYKSYIKRIAEVHGKRAP